MPDEPAPARPAPVTLPSPEQLGVALPCAEDSGPDWAAVRGQLRELGAVGFQLDRLAGGQCQFVCWLPGTGAGGPERIETKAATEAEAVRLGLERAERWRRQHP